MTADDGKPWIRVVSAGEGRGRVEILTPRGEGEDVRATDISHLVEEIRWSMDGGEPAELVMLVRRVPVELEAAHPHIHVLTDEGSASELAEDLTPEQVEHGTSRALAFDVLDELISAGVVFPDRAGDWQYVDAHGDTSPLTVDAGVLLRSFGDEHEPRPPVDEAVPGEDAPIRDEYGTCRSCWAPSSTEHDGACKFAGTPDDE